MEQVNSEKVRVCYVLAQILAVMAWFFIIAGGFTYSTPQDIINTADKTVNLCEKILSFENQIVVTENITF